MERIIILSVDSWRPIINKIYHSFPEYNWKYEWSEIFKSRLSMSILAICPNDADHSVELTFASEQDKLMFILKYM